MKDLLFYVLRLLLQVLIFALTGHWPHFDRAPRRGGQPAVQPPTRAPGRTRARRSQRGTEPPPTRSWSYLEEGTAYELEAPPEGGPVRVRAVPKHASAAPVTCSLGRALRDRRVLRDALVLDAALGRRRPGR